MLSELRWRITTEAVCPLCSKDVSTTGHISGACKISLQEGRYTFRQDTVLRGDIEVLKSFIVNLKEIVPISAKSSIRFVRKVAKVTRKRTPPVGILHHASQWILLADLNKNCCFPVHIAFTETKTWHYNFLKQFKKSYSHWSNMPLWRKYGILTQY